MMLLRGDEVEARCDIFQAGEKLPHYEDTYGATCAHGEMIESID